MTIAAEQEKQKWPFEPLQPGDHEPVEIPPRRKLLAAAFAGAVLAGLGACASSESESARSAGEYTDDAALTAKVKTAIATDAGARTAAAVNVETYRGVVQLTGFVDSEDQATRAVSAAKKVQGVRSVKNDIRLKR